MVWLSDTSPLHQIALIGGIAAMQVLRIVKRMNEIVFHVMRRDHYDWPNADRIEQFRQQWADHTPFQHCIGALDGSHLPITKAPRRHLVSYVNRKGRLSISMQAIAAYDLRIIYCCIGFPGCMHDARTYTWTQVHNRENEYFGNDNYVLADNSHARS